MHRSGGIGSLFSLSTY
uniref:Uncharacterized protein n=1 Tax=Arundo donax TaxID=35708 RepID=A0A0A9CDE6_ARUDO